LFNELGRRHEAEVFGLVVGKREKLILILNTISRKGVKYGRGMLSGTPK
jgi:hypothetical protein